MLIKIPSSLEEQGLSILEKKGCQNATLDQTVRKVCLVYERIKSIVQYAQEHPKEVLKNTSLGIGVAGTTLGIVLAPLGFGASAAVSGGFGGLGLSVYKLL